MSYQDPLYTVKRLLVDGKPSALGSPRNWPNVDARKLTTDTGYVDVDLIGNIDNCIARGAVGIANAVQFPVSTTFLHGMAVLSAAAVLKFSYQMRMGSQHTPPAIYAASAQPSGAGKTAVHNFYFMPFERAFKDLRKDALRRRGKIKGKLEALRGELKNQTAPAAREAIEDEIVELELKLEQIELFTIFTTDDPTPEGLTSMARKNGGYFSTLSDEGQAINTLLGGQYTAAGKNSSANIVLKGYDNGAISVVRSKDIKLKNGSDDEDSDAMFRARGVVASLAQTESIDAIIEVGKRGVGVVERFFLVEEEPLLGRRRHTGRSNVTGPNSDDVLAIDRLMHAVITSRQTVLYFDDEVGEYIARIRDAIEPQLVPGQRYGYPMVQGFMAKVERHITGLACLLHIANEWAPGGQRDECIKLGVVKQAAELFRKLCESTIASIEARSAGSGRAEMSTVYNKFCNHVERKRMFFMTYRELRDAVKKEAAFRGIKDLTSHLREITLRRMAEQGICLPVKSGIYINPNVR